MVEIELKAWVDDPVSLESRLAAMGEFCGRSEKRDWYWSLPGADVQGGRRKFRVRDEDGVQTVTFKDKTLSGSVEVNHEREFRVAPADAFIELMQRAGSLELSRKRKSSKKYRVGSCLVESVTIEGLGDFIEIEILTEEAGPVAVDRAKSELLAVLDEAGIPRNALEARFYSDLLAEAERHASAARGSSSPSS
jgi:adenylate cyclase class 2